MNSVHHHFPGLSEEQQTLLEQAFKARKKPADQLLEATKKAEKAVADVTNPSVLGTVELLKGLSLQRLGRYDDARVVLEQSVQRLNQSGDKARETDSLIQLGHVLFEKAQYEAALEMFFKALQNAQELRSEKAMAQVKDRIGRVYHFLGQYRAAREQLEEAVQLFEEQEDTKGQARAQASLGLVLDSQGEHNKAMQELRKGYMTADMYSDGLTVAFAAFCFAMVHLQNKAYEEAKKYLDEAKRFFSIAGDASYVAQLSLMEAEIAMAEGKNGAARQRLENAREIAEPMGLNYLDAWIAEKDYLFLEQEGKYQEALEAYMKYSTILRNRTHENSVVTLHLMEQNHKYAAQVQKEELERLRSTELGKAVADSEAKTAELERQRQAVLDNQQRTLRLQQLIFPDDDETAASWPGAKVYFPDHLGVRNAFVWPHNCGGHYLAMAVVFPGRDVSAGLLLAAAEQVLQITPHRKDSPRLEDALQGLDDRLFSTLPATELARSNTRAGRFSFMALEFTPASRSLRYAGAGVQFFLRNNGDLQPVKPTAEGSINLMNPQQTPLQQVPIREMPLPEGAAIVLAPGLCSADEACQQYLKDFQPDAPSEALLSWVHQRQQEENPAEYVAPALSVLPG